MSVVAEPFVVVACELEQGDLRADLTAVTPPARLARLAELGLLPPVLR